MSSKSNNQGRAYEYICLLTFKMEIEKYRKVEVTYDNNYQLAEKAWNLIDDILQQNYITSARASVKTIFEAEPLLLEENDLLKLSIQPDSKGIEGDIRDILIVRDNIGWEIGLSIKHNHFAVKHSRLSKNIDFSNRWFGIKCSNQYWDDVSNIFSFLEEKRSKKVKWSEIENKATIIYKPLLQAFINEIKRQYSIHSHIPKKMVEYLLGEYDFYKIISIDHEKVTQIQGYNFRGSLNKSIKNKPNIIIPISSLPTRIVDLSFKPNSNNTVELYLDGGWQFNFRIHNASSFVEPSLKFDIQIIGMPADITTINCIWNS